MGRWICHAQWSDWCDFLATPLDRRVRWRLPLLIVGMVFATGRRTVSAWLRAQGLHVDWQDFYYFVGIVGRHVWQIAERLVVLVIIRLPLGDVVVVALDDSPTKRFGPHVQGAGIHHNPTPGPADQTFLYGHIWVTMALVVEHPLWGWMGLPILGLLYVRKKDIVKIPWWEFQTKLQLAQAMVIWLATLLRQANKTLVVVADGAYAKRPFLKPLRDAKIVVLSRLRKDAALYTVPAPPSGPRGRGRPRIYGTKRISLAKRAAHRQGWQQIDCRVYGRVQTKTFKTFLATYPPAGGILRVVLVKEEDKVHHLFSTDENQTAQQIIEHYASRAVIEQNFSDEKEVWGAGEQQVRNIYSNIGCWNLCLWLHTLVELWAWDQPREKICDRADSPWDVPDRRPSHADRRKALQRLWLENQFLWLAARETISRKIRRFVIDMQKLIR